MQFSKQFVCATRERTTFEHHVPAPIFRKSFMLDDIPQRARILICGLGFYDLWINGEKITKGYLAPYISNPDDLIYYDRYEVSSYLRKGENVIGVMLGGGFQTQIMTVWDFKDAKFNASPKLALSFECGDISFSAPDFLCSESEILFNDYRCGVHCDAGKIQKGWNDAGFDHSGWRAPLMAEMPRGEAKLCTAEPITEECEIKPVSVKKGQLIGVRPEDKVSDAIRSIKPVESPSDSDGGYIFDFGINGAGIYRLRINGSKGQKISMQFAERLTDGKVDPSNISYFYPEGYGQRDIYICSGEGEEIFVPPFVYHGYRYVYVTGVTEEQAKGDLLTYLVLHSELPRRAEFSCSDEMTNTLWQITQRSDLSNFYYFPTDCPHREKNGWTGDASMSSEHMIFTLGVEKSWREWLNNIRAAQDQSGALPGIIPTAGWGFDWGNGPAWDSVLFSLPYNAYVYRGDKDIINENAHAMLRYLEYVSRRRNDRGIVEIGLGDWCPVGREPADYKVPLGFTDSVMVMDMCAKSSVMFRAVGLDLNALFAETLYKEMREAVRRVYLDKSSLLFDGNCQTGQAMGLYYGVYDSGERQQAFDKLLEIIHVDGDSMDVGYLGARALFHVLSDFGQSDLAFRMITKKEYPSYGNIVARGATTLWEMFEPEGTGCGSENHHFWGDINHWFMRQLCGFNVNPEKNQPDRIVIKPRFVSSLQFVKGSYEAPAGAVKSEWRREDGVVYLTVQSDAGTVCETELENGNVFRDSGLSYMSGDFENAAIIRKR